MPISYSLESCLIVHLDHGVFILHLPSIKLVFDTVMFANWVVYVVY